MGRPLVDMEGHLFDTEPLTDISPLVDIEGHLFDTEPLTDISPLVDIEIPLADTGVSTSPGRHRRPSDSYQRPSN